MGKKKSEENEELAASHFLQTQGNKNSELRPIFSKRSDACKQYTSGQFGGWAIGRSVFYTMKPIQDMGPGKKSGKQEMWLLVQCQKFNMFGTFFGQISNIFMLLWRILFLFEKK